MTDYQDIGSFYRGLRQKYGDPYNLKKRSFDDEAPPQPAPAPDPAPDPAPAEDLNEEQLTDARRSSVIPSLVAHWAHQNASTSSMPQEDLNKAYLTQASYEMKKGGLQGAREYLDSKGMNEWKLDSDLSNENELVSIDPKTQKPVVSVRGSVFSKKSKLGSLKELKNAYLHYRDKQKRNPRFKSVENTLNKVADEYNISMGEIQGTGHGLGGGIIHQLGRKYNMKTTTFNAWNRAKDDGYKPNVKQTEYRVTDDPTSFMNRPAHPNTEVNTVLTNQKGYTAMGSHSMTNFTEGWDKSRGSEHNELLRDHLASTREFGDKNILDAMIKSKEQGLTFTQHLQKSNLSLLDQQKAASESNPLKRRRLLSRGVNSREIVEGGVLNGVAVDTDNIFVKKWKDVGGKFSRQEIEAIQENKPAESQNDPAPKQLENRFNNQIEQAQPKNTLFAMSQDEVDKFIKLPEDEREAQIKKARIKMSKATSAFADSPLLADVEDFNIPDATQSSAPRSRIKEGFRTLTNPKAWLGNYASSIAVDKIFDDFVPDEGVDGLEAKDSFSRNLTEAVLGGEVYRSGGKAIGKIKDFLSNSVTKSGSNSVAKAAEHIENVTNSAGEFAEEFASNPLLEMEGGLAAGAGEAGFLRTAAASATSFAVTYGAEKGLDKVLKFMGLSGKGEGAKAARDIIEQPLADALGAATFAVTEAGPAGLLVAPEAAILGGVVGLGSSVVQHFSTDVHAVGSGIAKGATKVADFFKSIF